MANLNLTTDSPSWGVIKLILTAGLSASLMLAGWVGVQQNNRLNALEIEKTSAERALVLARQELTKELNTMAERNTEDHARIFTKLDILLQQHGIVVRSGVK